MKISALNFIKKYIQKRGYKKRNVDILSNSEIYPKIGFVLDLGFHLSNRWVVAVTPYRMNAIIKELNCIIIQNQKDYERYKDDLNVIISTAVGWSAPYIKYEKRKPDLKYIIIGDPHHKADEKQRYFIENDFSYVLAHYYNPTIFHFRHIPKEKILHFSWSIPDEFINRKEIKMHNQDYILLFGATNDEAYETRIWCKNFNFVKSVSYSGVENKVMIGRAYFDWLQQFDAATAAGSLNPRYRLVMPKYFEIASVGSLLFAQEAEDLELLDFKDNENCIVFNNENFEEKARAYLNNKEAYLNIREAGRNLILEQHTLSKRIGWLKRHIMDNL